MDDSSDTFPELNEQFNDGIDDEFFDFDLEFLETNDLLDHTHQQATEQRPTIHVQGGPRCISPCELLDLMRLINRNLHAYFMFTHQTVSELSGNICHLVKKIHCTTVGCPQCIKISTLLREASGLLFDHSQELATEKAVFIGPSVFRSDPPKIQFDSERLRAAAQYYSAQNSALFALSDWFRPPSAEIMTSMIRVDVEGKFHMSITVKKIESLIADLRIGNATSDSNTAGKNKRRKEMTSCTINQEYPWNRGQQVKYPRKEFHSEEEGLNFVVIFFKILQFRYSGQEDLQSYGILQYLHGELLNARSKMANALDKYLMEMLRDVHRSQENLLYLRTLAVQPLHYLKFQFLPYTSATQAGTDESKKRTCYGIECSVDQLAVIYEQLEGKPFIGPVDMCQHVVRGNLEWCLTSPVRYFLNYLFFLDSPSFGREFIGVAEAESVGGGENKAVMVFYTPRNTSNAWSVYGSSENVIIQKDKFSELCV